VHCICSWLRMKMSPLRARVLSTALWLVCAAVMSGGIYYALAQQGEQIRRKRDYCDEAARKDGFLPKSCCTPGTLNANDQCEETPVRTLSLNSTNL
jgi:hypothetical protein